MTQFSLTEIDALAAKAARGAGYSWGMAEEAGIATRWLQAKGLPGTTLLLAHLTNMGGTNWPTIAPQIHANTWTTATGTPLCPLATGATLCDHAALITLPLTFTSIATPALLLPFAASLSKILATPLRLTSPSGHAILNGDDLWLDTPQNWPTAPLTLTQTTRPTTPPYSAAIQPIPQTTLTALTALALRTTVPPSAQSRASAGATGSDND